MSAETLDGAAPERCPRHHRYFLGAHVHACELKRHWIVLDVSRDQYYCIPRVEFELIAPFLADWERPGADAFSHARKHTESPQALRATGLLEQLVSKGVLVSEECDAAPLRRRSHDISCVLASAPRKCSAITPPLDAIRFFRACRAAHFSLEHRTFADIVGSALKRLAHASSDAGSERRVRLERWVQTFIRLRPWYPRPYLCLFDSLALLNLLAGQGIRVNWVFGVAADPFQAHCWLQEGATLLNDSISRVSQYRSIMVV